MKLSFETPREDYAQFNKFHFLKTRLKRTILTGGLTVVFLQFYLVFGRKLHFRRCVKKNNRSFTPVNLTIIFFNTPRNGIFPSKHLVFGQTLLKQG